MQGDLAERAAKGFRARYGAPPAGVWAAPGRVNLIGEHTDYNDGYVLPFAIPRVTAVAAAPRQGREWTVWSESTDDTVHFGEPQLEPGALGGWAGYVAGVVWSLAAAGWPVPGARLAVATDVPIGAGLSSSAALECAVLTALVEVAGGAGVPLTERPRLAQRAENDYVGVPCGIMDQSAATLCRAGHALFLDCRTLAVRQVPFELAADGLAVLVVDTNAPHRLVTGEYAARRAACEAAARRLGVPALRDIPPDGLDAALSRLGSDVTWRRVRHVVTENARVLSTVEQLATGEVRAVGPLLTASHASLRDDFEVTVPELDTAVEVALVAGAYGARMTGGGFGGCVLALVDRAAAGDVAEAVTNAFGRAGFAPPSWFVADPADGARRLA